METCSKIAEEVPAAPQNEKTLEAVTTILNMAFRSMNVLSQVWAVWQVEALSEFERAKVIQCARFVVEHVAMFPEDIVLRFALLDCRCLFFILLVSSEVVCAVSLVSGCDFQGILF